MKWSLISKLISVVIVLAVSVDFLLFTAYRVDYVLMTTYMKHMLLLLIAYRLVITDEKNGDA